MAKQSNIGIRITGIETKADKEAFVQKCGDFWMSIISEKINELSIDHQRKLKFADDVICEIHRRAGLNG
ncbi:hypothetical protein HNQ80_000858 [Anaerosolibacter carboniphilus]|uniref:Uncharacterized protein n=1 Tax=Anaerosolibacter carboniphilus TaxID=1417629 RepID=A0A841KMZ9_9FIRM|nr:hypothetical protein [Anaerosolibacter carboniphilus]MBB6214773.1 hypothetical protein [Anaerosolibacter carboniphilus]